MKLFNNFSISWLLAAIIMLLMVACSESKDGTEPSADPNSVKVEISTEVITQANVTTELVQGDKMNIYALFPMSWLRAMALNGKSRPKSAL